jgi:hypothetical protein
VTIIRPFERVITECAFSPFENSHPVEKGSGKTGFKRPIDIVLASIFSHPE